MQEVLNGRFKVNNATRYHTDDLVSILKWLDEQPIEEDRERVPWGLPVYFKEARSSRWGRSVRWSGGDNWTVFEFDSATSVTPKDPIELLTWSMDPRAPGDMATDALRAFSHAFGVRLQGWERKAGDLYGPVGWEPFGLRITKKKAHALEEPSTRIAELHDLRHKLYGEAHNYRLASSSSESLEKLDTTVNTMRQLGLDTTQLVAIRPLLASAEESLRLYQAALLEIHNQTPRL